MAKYVLERGLNVVPGPNGGSVLVPGCEPESVLTSTRMAAEMQRDGTCQCALAYVEDILEAIPGSRISFVLNGGIRSKILVLPPVLIGCPSDHTGPTCYDRPDHYQTIRDLCHEATEEEEQAAMGCDAFSLYTCQRRQEWRGQS